MKVLVVASHPDDEVLGCGGTIARLVDEGHEVHILCITDGVMSREFWADEDKTDRQTASFKAAEVLGVKPWHVYHWQRLDQRLDDAPILHLVQSIEGVLNTKDLGPFDRIYTHHAGDLNIDHQITARAVLTATRPQPGCKVKEIFAFEVPSSTEWNFGTAQPFVPNVYVDISDYGLKKLEALNCYEGEMRPDPHPRSPTHITFKMRVRGSEAGVEYAEAFMLLRGIY